MTPVEVAWDPRVSLEARARIVSAVNLAVAEAATAAARAEVEAGEAYAGAAAVVDAPGRWRRSETRWQVVCLAAELADRGLPQRAIARRLGVGQSTVCKLLAEHRAAA